MSQLKVTLTEDWTDEILTSGAGNKTKHLKIERHIMINIIEISTF